MWVTSGSTSLKGRLATKHYSLFMFTKLYKIIEGKGLHYKEMWFDDTKDAVIIHWGKVGFVGKTEEYSMTIEEAKDYLKKIILLWKEEGYHEFPDEELIEIIIQFPLKSEQGNKRDKWLGEKCSEYVQAHLGWRGLGYSEGPDIRNKKLNIFCVVVDEDKAVSSIKTCLKTYRLDLTHAIIAARRWNEDGEFRVKYSHKPVKEFLLI